jgi:hypothetical protein
VFEPEAWLGKRLPLINLIYCNQDIAKGNWLVILYHHDCPSCQEAMPKYEQLGREAASQPDASRVALIEIPPYSKSINTPNTGESHLAFGRLSDSKNWFITTPAEIFLRDCIVVPREGCTTSGRPIASPR